MRDGLAARHLALGTLDIDMDPLTIAGRLGEAVDHRLIDREPFRGAELLARMGGHVGRPFDLQHRGLLS